MSSAIIAEMAILLQNGYQQRLGPLSKKDLKRLLDEIRKNI